MRVKMLVWLGEDVEPGSIIDVDEDRGAELIADECAVPAQVEVVEDEPLEDRVVAAIAVLPEGGEHWTKDGKPDCDALAEIVGKRVPAAVRDAAWARVQGESAD